MADYSIADLTAAAGRAGFSGPSQAIAVAVSLAEDGARALHAVGLNGDGSRDRGPWQINDRAHPDVPDGCAFDLDCAAAAAYRISDGGRDWSPWTTYVSGAYRAHLQDSQPAASSSGGDQGIGAFGSQVAGAIGSAGRGLTDTALGALLALLGAAMLGVAVWMLARQTGPGQAAQGLFRTAARVGVAAVVHV